GFPVLVGGTARLAASACSGVGLRITGATAPIARDIVCCKVIVLASAAGCRAARAICARPMHAAADIEDALEPARKRRGSRIATTRRSRTLGRAAEKAMR